MDKVKVFNATIKLRKDTESNWKSQDPLLLYGEKATVVMESGEIKHKTGDGLHQYNQLPFDEDSIYNAIDSTKSKTITLTLMSNSWTDENTQTIKIIGIDENTNGIASLPHSMTDEQYDAAALSGLYISGQQKDYVTFKCRYGAPKINIPVCIIILG